MNLEALRSLFTCSVPDLSGPVRALLEVEGATRRDLRDHGTVAYRENAFIRKGLFGLSRTYKLDPNDLKQEVIWDLTSKSLRVGIDYAAGRTVACSFSGFFAYPNALEIAGRLLLVTIDGDESPENYGMFELGARQAHAGQSTPELLSRVMDLTFANALRAFGFPWSFAIRYL